MVCAWLLPDPSSYWSPARSAQAPGTTPGPADALTHIATEPDAPDEALAPYEEMGIAIVR